MRTAIVADLHLGSRLSVAGDAAGRGRLLAAVEGADRVVLLGDTLSLRDVPMAVAVAAARPLFDALGDREVILVPGNHDHRLAAPIVEAGGGLGLEQRLVHDGPLGRLTLAYPGVWLRPGVYATHGHYGDAHTTIPRPESIAARAMAALVGSPRARATPEDYERILAPICAFAHARAQSRGDEATMTDGTAGRLARIVKRGGWKVIERRSGLTPERIGAAGLTAMHAVVGRLGLAADHVIFGHTHRAGPMAGEDWRGLHNPGSWLHAEVLIGPERERDPYWPGRVLELGDTGPPALRTA